MTKSVWDIEFSQHKSEPYKNVVPKIDWISDGIDLLGYPKDVLNKVSDGRLFQFHPLLEQMPKEVILAGGSLRGCFSENEIILDFDLFVIAEPSLEQYERRRIQQGVHRVLIAEGYEQDYNNSKGYLTTWTKKDMKVQLIMKHIFSDIKELLCSFDLFNGAIAYDRKMVYTCAQAVLAGETKTVRVQNAARPNIIKRLLKYQKKGYEVDEETLDMVTKAIYNMGVNGEKN